MLPPSATLVPDALSGPVALPPEVLVGDGLLYAEVYSVDQLVRHARALGGWHRVDRGRGANPLLTRLDANEQRLRLVFAGLRAAPQVVVPAGEWLIDNQHLVLEQITIARRHLPRRYSYELPRLIVGEPAGAPRVYALALELLSHTDSRVDEDTLLAFISAYQEVAPLTMGELWAVPTMLRLALLENVRRIAVRVEESETMRRAATGWAQRLVRIADEEPSALVIALGELARDELPGPVFVAELHRGLQGQSPALALVLHWLDQRLAERHQTMTELIRTDHQAQAADQLAVQNAITSVRRMAVIDWRDFVEGLSPVERTLRRDPAGIYATMDFATRDQYRHAVELLARRCRPAGAAAEAAVAEAAVGLCVPTADATAPGVPSNHVGWWLVDGGREAFERHLARTSGLRRPGNHGTAPLPTAALFAPLALLTAAGTTAAAWCGGPLLGALAALPASQAALGLVNWAATRLVAPRRLSRLELPDGIPMELATLVAVPTMLRQPADVTALCEGLLVRHLANRDAGLAFALLTDFGDAASVVLPEDAALLEQATSAIAGLNAQYGERFLLLHRPRVWNDVDHVWMGHERKRGKIEDLNQLLLTGDHAPFALVTGATARLTGIRYVIVLDTDTRLPRDAARELVATIAHPLNRPRLDPVSGLVQGGHGLLQPRAAIGLASARRSWYATLWSGDAGIDPYTRAISDVYQDLFQSGSFIGKGIYDLAAFSAALGRRFPQNAVLSHDLIEGCHARSALVSDVLVVEDHPARYLADMARRKRWIRGDWQLLPWLGCQVPTAAGRLPNPLDLLSRWKLVDNLRRSLVGPATLALLLTTWGFATPAATAILTLAIVCIWLLNTALGTLGGLLPSAEIPLLAHLRRVAGDGARGATTSLYELVVLPFEAATALDAIVRTLWRLGVSRHHLLEWQTSTDAERLASGRLVDVAGAMAIAPLAGVGAAAIAWLRPELTPAILPFAVAWTVAPLIAWALSQPRRDRPAVLDEDDLLLIRRTARLTWRYFAEQVANPEHPLPPDNVQDQPVTAVAHRTSPTNIGLALLAELAAHDLGWQTSGRMLDRVGRVLTATLALERHRGHLYNWYDTRSGAPLAPRYVTMVDSGNLAGHLLVLAAGLRELAHGLPAAAQRIAGVRTTLRCAGGSEATALAASSADLVQLASSATALAARSSGEARDWCQMAGAEATAHLAELVADQDEALPARAKVLAQQASDLALGMEWDFLLDPHSKLFSIGWQVEDGHLDRSAYELLASESRLGSFVAVAGGGVAQEHWFRLGRQQVRCAGGQALMSWSGTLFEYLMPALVMPEEPGTLLDASNRAAVAEQQRYAALRGVPWGISESAYNLTDAQLNWQYRAFGVPGLGLKRGLADDLVVAPYASALALLIDPVAAVVNLRRLVALGAEGRYGFCEAIDFTTARLPVGVDQVVIRSWMVHHQGMSLLACLHVLADAPMRRRFLADPRLQAHRLLLQERPAPTALLAPTTAETTEVRAQAEPGLRVVTDPQPVLPEIHLLSNGRWQVLITSSGAGFSRWRGLAVNRWREDSTVDGGGPALYLRDAADGHLWSTTHQPVGALAETYEAIFTQARAEFRRLDRGIATHTEIAISPEDDVELRRVTLTNRNADERTLELTTCAEPVLAPAAAELAHPSFSNLFVETELLAEAEALLASRRPRRGGDARPWLVHLLLVREGEARGALSWETDRRAFIGRGRDPATAIALTGTVGAALGGTLGAVLDPALALRRMLRMPAGGRAVVDVVYAAAETREAAVALAHRYRDAHLADRIFGLSWTHGQVVLAQLGTTEVEAQVFGRLAGSLVIPTSHRRLPSAILRNRRTRSGLWSHSISGDLPVMLLRVTDGQRIDLVRQILRAHAWWRGGGLAVDLVILIEDPSVYRQELTERVIGLVASGPAAGQLDRPGGIFVRRSDLVPEEDRYLLAAVARLVVTDAGGSLAQYADRRVRAELPAPRLMVTRSGKREAPLPPPAFDLQQWNGLGGFTRDGREYIIVLPPGTNTPLPWCNVLANPAFGSVVSERGAAYTWSGNCHEYRLTPWRCDAVADPHGEAVYLRDEETGICWSPTPGPLTGRSTRVVRHGFGYSVFMAGEEGIASELHMWVDANEPVKHLRLQLVNRSKRPRRLSAFCLAEWTLGELRERTAAGLVTEHADGVLYARNPLHDEFSGQTAFLAVNRRVASWTCDRNEFLGRGGSAAQPAALGAARLLGRAGAALDPCAALQVMVELEPGQERVVVFTIGCGRDRGHATSLADQQRRPDVASASLNGVYEYWKNLLGRLQVRTSDPTLDLLANGWLTYQIMAARILARSGFLQSGGAWGFRDQLQDAMAMVHHEPRLLREQLVRCASRQFRDGDVQHWWHPPQGRGVRTRISDDYLWLPYALCRYLDSTGDHSVLQERQPFLDGPQVPPDQESLYDLPTVTDEQSTVYEHAVRAVLHGMRYGEHGLPLIGTGDWNDGMDRVGHHGKGESVWLAFFLCDVLRRFAPLAAAAGDAALAERLGLEAEALAKRIDVHAWENDRYLRAWMDDGTPLGSATANECRIDALPQAWSAITGICRPERAQAAMESVDQLLVRRGERLIQLFDPPFDQGPVEPGYIKGYVPGVRENGGQYTHAAVWTAMGFAALGDGARALELARLIDPIRHGSDPARWQGEPYVLAADVYRTPGHVGRAGWTWYTGSAGWMLRLILESLLGVVREGPYLRVVPCLPTGFGAYEVLYHNGAATWLIAVRGDGAVRSVSVDGQVVSDGRISLHDDGLEHAVEIERS